MLFSNVFFKFSCACTKLVNVSIVFTLSLMTTQVFAQTVAGKSSTEEVWTLSSSVDQALLTSPELKKSIAKMGALQADISLSKMWPEPEIGFRVDNKLGQDDKTGGYDLTDITIRQPIPLSRMKYQTSAASANLKAARFFRQYESLRIQNRVSKVFHQLQFSSAKLSLAEKQLKLADKLNNNTKKTDKSIVVRYLTPLEKMRLTILREEARQAASNAEGKYNEALAEFIKLLQIENSHVASVSELLPLTEIPDINHLLLLQNKHVQLSAQQQKVVAANHEIEVARNSQMIDPTVGLSWSRDTFANGRDDIYAIMFNMQIPIGERKDTAADKATFKASEQRIELELIRRELKINLNKSFTHLNNVVEQAKEYKQKVLKPAKKMLSLTDKGFASGELNILSLVDANNTYFEARGTYIELLFHAWIELAEVKLFAGQMLSDVDTRADIRADTRAKSRVKSSGFVDEGA